MRNAIVLRNLDWVSHRTKEDPQFFRRRAEGPGAGLLWIGCSDNGFANFETAPFEDGVFVHRNVGNQVSHHDLSLGATLQSALHIHKVSDIVVCGHYGCRCLRDVLSVGQAGPLEAWGAPIGELVRQNLHRLDAIISMDAQVKTLCEINVRAQLANLAAHAAVEPLLALGKLQLHGLVWSPRDGLLREIDLASSKGRQGAAASEKSPKRSATRRLAKA